jgi:probable HAF family extracellular repeat protein
MPTSGARTWCVSALAAGLVLASSSRVHADLSEAEVPASIGVWGLGDLPGGPFQSASLAMTRDARTVVGTSASAEGPVAFIWRAETGMQPLGELAGGQFYSEALAVSADGERAVGVSTSGLAFAESCAWNIGGPGIRALGDFRDGPNISIATGISRDGTIVVGAGSTAAGYQAFRWTLESGMLPVGVFAGYTETQASKISGNGAVIIGSGRRSFPARTEAFRWTRDLGMVGLGDLPGGLTLSEAQCLSDDGVVVAGYSVSTGDEFQAFVWTPRYGMRGLGDLPEGPVESYAREMTPDGSVIVGIGSTAVGYEAFYWTAGRGMRRLADVLSEAGGNVGGWRFIRAQAVSADGSVVVGQGLNPRGEVEAFLVRLPVPPTTSDWNRSGAIDPNDLFDFLADFTAGRADFDRNGVTNPADLFAYVDAYFARQ